MSPVCCSECVVDVAVSVGSELLDELLLAFLYGSLGCFLLLVGSVLCESAGFAFLLSVEAEVLKEESLARLEGGCLCVCLLAVLSELYGYSELLGYVVNYMLEGELGVNSLRASEVGHNDN